MEQNKHYRRGAARQKNLPADANSLAQQFSELHELHLPAAANHYRRNPHDYKARRRLQILHDQRARSWEKLRELDHERAANLIKKFKLIYSRPEEVTNDKSD